MALPPGATISAVTTLQASTAPGACKVSSTLLSFLLSLCSCAPGRSFAVGEMRLGPSGVVFHPNKPPWLI